MMWLQLPTKFKRFPCAWAAVKASCCQLRNLVRSLFDSHAGGMVSECEAQFSVRMIAQLVFAEGYMQQSSSI
jgi:hypothetical protein